MYGWVREAERDLKLSNVPNMISCICIMYLREDEIFQYLSDDGKIKLSADKKIATLKKGYMNFLNVFGIVEVASMNKAIYQWDLKMTLTIEYHNQYGVVVDHIVYILQGMQKYSRSWKRYGASFMKDKVSINLDLKKKEIRFLVNDQDQGIAYQNIKTGEDIKYRLVVSLYAYASVTIDNFVTK